jgi:hypothetical protein
MTLARLQCSHWNPTGMADVNTWRILIVSREPVYIDDSEIMQARTFRDVLERARVLVGRTSYMVNGPNREVFWSIEVWNRKAHTWQTICENKSRLKEGIKPK